MAKANLTAERLREVLHYDPKTGHFIWLIDVGRWGRTKAGTLTGSPDITGHLRTQVDGTLYYCHRLAFLYMNGRWPSGDVDHIDGVSSNNAWSNLRDVTHKMNTQNRRSPNKNKLTGLPIGVSLDARDGGIRSDITVDGKTRSLGRYATPELAHQAYVNAKRILHEGNTL